MFPGCYGDGKKKATKFSAEWCQAASDEIERLSSLVVDRWTNECQGGIDRIVQAHIDDVNQRLAAAEARYEVMREERDANAHVIIECNIAPGIDSTCRCDQCLSVARSMDEAGYMDDIRDKWWIERAQAAGGEG